MNPKDAVFFDFDGVILDSVDVKTRAFAELFRPYGEEIERKVVEYHLNNGGISRYDKFRYYYEQLLGERIDDPKLTELGEIFSSLALGKVMKAPFIDGAIETLRQLKTSNIPAFVVSGTPEDEVKHIVKERKLDIYFKEVHGSPRKKEIIVRDICDRFGFENSRCLFIGDAMTDYRAAKDAGVPFLGIVKIRRDSPFPIETKISTAVQIL